MGYTAVTSSGLVLQTALTGRLGGIVLMIGIMATGFLLIVAKFRRARELYGRGDSAGPDQRTNCPSCGARIPADADTCGYCGDPIDGGP